MSITINTRAYTLDSQGADTARFAGPAHTLSQADTFELQRAYPKPGRNGDLGVGRPSVKRVKSVVVNATTGERKDLRAQVLGSVPVGTANADIDALCDDVAAFLSSAQGKALFKSLVVYAG
jgi:hypothetical protein